MREAENRQAAARINVQSESPCSVPEPARHVQPPGARTTARDCDMNQTVDIIRDDRRRGDLEESEKDARYPY